MLFSILWRYFFKYYLKITIYVLSAVIIVIFIIDLNEIQIQKGSLPGYTDSEGALLAITRIPLIIEQTIPFTTLVISMIVFFNLNRKNELVIARASGISIWQLLSPFVTGSFLLGMFIILILSPIVNTGEKIGSLLIEQWSNPQGKSNLDVIPWIHVKHEEKDVFIGAEAILEQKKLLAGTTIFTINPKNGKIIRQESDFAIIHKKMISLNKVMEYTYEKPPIFRDSMTINLSISMSDFHRLYTQFTSYSIYDIVQKARFSGISDIFHNSILELQFYFLMTTPFMLIAMTLIAASVSLGFNHSVSSRIIITYGILAGFMLYTIIIVMKSLGKAGIILPSVATSIPIISTISLSIFILLQKEDC
ncbi:MAG: LptF/LptG family permease [Candidatus Liberibacter ctenarytainae]|uniref:LptF/LptG family permease n=1 Tax=Candidatus Liberibacter ctenarytainae TaxID=2020335 RepID=A0A937ADZ1_9HYPH|nr:LptF/LptG family permease [Candidatus Liberibacter ctenarytainae]